MLTLSRPLTTDFSAVRPEIRALQAELVAWRRQVHQRPELGFQEEITAQFICDRLSEWGIPFERAIAKTGIVATIPSPTPPLPHSPTPLTPHPLPCSTNTSQKSYPRTWCPIKSLSWMPCRVSPMARLTGDRCPNQSQGNSRQQGRLSRLKQRPRLHWPTSGARG